jgi:hypothetical protein
VWFVKIVGGASGWFVVYIGAGVENKSMVVYEKENG